LIAELKRLKEKMIEIDSITKKYDNFFFFLLNGYSGNWLKTSFHAEIDIKEEMTINTFEFFKKLFYLSK
jgi:hypothetical protein